MDVIYRDGKKEDSLRIAELDSIASGGAAAFLFHDLIPGMTPVQIVASSLERDSYPHSYRSAMVAEYDDTVIGMSLSFPGRFHKITEEMKTFFPPERLDHFKHFFSAPVGDSFYLDALCVEAAFRNRGIGSKLIALTKAKARKEGYSSLCLIVFKDNARAQHIYQKNGFNVIGGIELPPHELMPHEGGCLLMKAGI